MRTTAIEARDSRDGVRGCCSKVVTLEIPDRTPIARKYRPRADRPSNYFRSVVWRAKNFYEEEATLDPLDEFSGPVIHE